MSAAALASLTEESDRQVRETLEEYRSRRARRESVVAAVERQLGKTFAKLTRNEYKRFMDRLDLNRDILKKAHIRKSLGESSVCFSLNL